MRAIINSCTVRYAVVIHITSGFTGFSSKDLLLKLIFIVNIVAAYKHFFPNLKKMRNCILQTTLMSTQNNKTNSTCNHIVSTVRPAGGAVCRGPRPTSSFGPQRELPPARLVIHRTDLCRHNVVLETLKGAFEVRLSRTSSPSNISCG